MQRTVFFISDGTAITTQTLGHSLLTQFPDVPFSQVTLPFVGDEAKARDAVANIDQAEEKDGAPPIVFVSMAIPHECRERKPTALLGVRRLNRG